MIGSFFKRVEAASPELTAADRAEWGRKFGKFGSLIAPTTVCPDCGLDWGRHSWFFCHAEHKALWKKIPTSSVVDDVGRIVHESYLTAAAEQAEQAGPYIVEYLDACNQEKGWQRSANSTTKGEFPSRQAAESALELNTHFKTKLFSFRVRSLQEALLDTVLAPAVPVASISANQEEEKMFQVSLYLFATGAVTPNAFSKLEDAQAFLERSVATYRQAGVTTNKTFFTASILDTKTGKYYGFVSDAPPEVTLIGASE